MAVYKNQSDMFRQRAESCKKSGDMFYAKAMEAKERGDDKKFQLYMAQSQAQYAMQRDNEARAKEHEGKTWRKSE